MYSCKCQVASRSDPDAVATHRAPGLGFGEDEVVGQRPGREGLEVQLQRSWGGGRILGRGQDGQTGQQERNDDGVIHDGGNR